MEYDFPFFLHMFSISIFVVAAYILNDTKKEYDEMLEGVHEAKHEAESLIKDIQQLKQEYENDKEIKIDLHKVYLNKTKLHNVKPIKNNVVKFTDNEDKNV